MKKIEGLPFELPNENIITAWSLTAWCTYFTIEIEYSKKNDIIEKYIIDWILNYMNSGKKFPSLLRHDKNWKHATNFEEDQMQSVHEIVQDVYEQLISNILYYFR